MAIVINGSGTVTGLAVGGLPDGTVDAGTLATDSVSLTEMASGTDGNIISYDASGNPVAIATGSDGQVLTSTGAGSPPAFEAIPGGGKILQVKHNYWHPGSAVTISNQLWLTDLDVTITPTSTNSRFISFITFGMLRQNADEKNIEVRYYRDSTTIDGGGYGLGYTEFNIGSVQNIYLSQSYTYEHQETAGNTNARTYKIRLNTNGNWIFHNAAANTHIVMEYEV